MTRDQGPNEIQLRAQATWEAFCEDLKSAGSQLIRADLPLESIDAAEGLRYLSRMVRTGLERHVESADPAIAHLYPLSDERIKGFGGDNPDTRYFGAALSSDYHYRLSGDFRSCAHVSLMTTGFDDDGSYRVTGSLDSAVMPDSRTAPVEIGICDAESNDRLEGVSYQLPTTPDTRSLLVRCTFEDMDAKEGLRLALTRTDPPSAPVACRFDPIAQGLREAAEFVRSTVQSCASQSAGLRQRFNQLPLQDPDRIRKAGGDPNVFYYSAAWSVAEDEFLVIELSAIPQCTAWGLQINNLWTESLDYTQAPIHVNKRTAVTNSAGGVTIVVSERDPGHPNWLRTMGHRSGTANLRLMGAKQPIEASLRVVRDADAI